jgi:hypothetical protein
MRNEQALAVEVTGLGPKAGLSGTQQKNKAAGVNPAAFPHEKSG